MKSKSTIRRHLKELREIIDNDDHCYDVVEVRIAYAMEQAVRWATQDTIRWPSLGNEALQNAAILSKELDL